MTSACRTLRLACGLAAILPSFAAASTDSRVNDISGESGSRTQNETALAFNESTGTLCSGFNDSYSGITLNANFTSFARSTDGGATWSDRGELAPPSGQRSFGNPSLVWRRSDGKFYMAALHSAGGLGFWRSDDDCTTFTWVGLASANTNDDREALAVDNTLSSPHYGRIYLAWTDFNLPGTQVALRHTDNGGGIWTTEQSISATLGGAPFGAWPAVAPDGTVYVSWVDRASDATVSMQIVRSFDGGGSWSAVPTQPAVNVVNPRDSAASATCSRNALKGNLRYLAAPQIAVGPDNVLHIVYARDPDTQDNGDAANVYYRRSTDAGATWSAEVRLNDDATTADQFFAALSVGPTGYVSVGWYDRRDDAANLRLHYYGTSSFDGGLTWEPNARLSDVDSPVVLDGSLATCYHGSYDTHVQTADSIVRQWGDDRPDGSGAENANVYVDVEPVSADFLVLAEEETSSLCAGGQASYTLAIPQFQGFSEPVTLSQSNAPAGSTPSFSVNPVTPPGASTFTIGGTGSVPFGTYTVTVTGTSSPSSVVHSTDLLLAVFTSIPSAPTLATPADAAVDVALQPVLTWSAGAQASSYTVEIATDNAFANVVYSRGDLTGTSHTVETPLVSTTTYFWRARGANACGAGTDASPFSFTTRVVPATLIVDDDDDNPDTFAAFAALLTNVNEPFDSWDTVNSDDEPSAADLAPYRRVLWITGGSSGGAAGPGVAGEAALSTWLSADLGRCLLLNSQDYLYDRGITTFGSTYLGIATDVDDAAHTTATGQGFFTAIGSATLTFPYSNFSDLLTPTSGTVGAFTGSGGPSAGFGSLYRDQTQWRTLFFTIPLESFPLAKRQETLLRIFELCDALFQDGFEGGNSSRWSAAAP